MTAPNTSEAPTPSAPSSANAPSRNAGAFSGTLAVAEGSGLAISTTPIRPSPIPAASRSPSPVPESRTAAKPTVSTGLRLYTTDAIEPEV